MATEAQNEKELWGRLPQTEGQERVDLLLQLAQEAVHRVAGTEALALAEEAHDICLQLGASASDALVVETYKGIGNSYKELNKNAEAAAVLTKAVDLERERQYPFLADTLRTQAFWYMDAEEYELSEECFIEAIMINELNGVEEFQAYDLFNLGNVYEKTGRFVEQIESVKRAREILKRLKKIKEVCRCDQKIGFAYAELGNHDLALEFSKKAFHVAELMNDNEWKCKSSLVMGRAHNLAGDFEDAEEAILRAEALVSDSSDWKTMVNVQKELIFTLINTKRFEDAEKAKARVATLEEILE